ncbi:hypothetical protein bcgnr5378_31420 [Bacillus cereus]|nr:MULTISPECIES: DUF5819 family protein [Bacillus cereus group]KXY98057.1 hypothetical protein AT280_28045 [Bacillus cereus]HDR4617048.1 hypothetical protein [Bacillus cereus]HDR4623035.1 hypothetical protein [Bacillus cereus]
MSKYVKGILIFFISILMVFHFSMIFLQSGPKNPLSIYLGNLSKGYTSTLFAQSWNLFAPNPVEVTSNILIQYRTESGEVSGWNNITLPINNANRENPISAYNKAARVTSGVYYGIFQMDEVVMSYKNKTTEEEFDKNIDTKLMEKGKSKQVDIMYRFAFSAIPTITNDKVTDVRIRIMNVPSVPFSERYNNDYEIVKEYIDFDWKKYEWVEGYL